MSWRAAPGNEARRPVELGDRYLCIVPASSARAKRVTLPFDGDEVLGVMARDPAFSGSISERAEKHHPAFPRSISSCSYFVATTERSYPKRR